MQRYFSFWIIIGLLSSCQNLDNFEINTVKNPQIIMQARLIARQSPKIYVGKLWGATAPRPKETFYRDADVELFENGKSVGKLFLKDTLYQNTNYILKPNTAYVIKTSVQGIESVESEPVLIPADIEIIKTSFDTKPSLSGTQYYFGVPCLVNVSFKVNKKVAGYGVNVSGVNKEEELLRCYNENLELRVQQGLTKSPCVFKTYIVDVDLNGTVGLSPFGNRSYLSRCINEPEKTVPIMVDLNGGILVNSSSVNYVPKSNQVNKLIVSVTAVSEEVIELSKTSKLLEGITASLSEPYPTYSNIKGGLGIVSGYNISYKILTIR